MIILNQLNKNYTTRAGTVTALNKINLQVTPGEIFGIIGKSGAGKSTLIRCVNLLERPDSGQVIVAGNELTALNAAGLRKARHTIGMIFQHFNLLASRSVFDNIALPLELYGYSKKHIVETVSDLLNFIGLVNKKNHFPSQLSGGQKQRVAIARALAAKPKVLLCDEITSALDPETTNTILQLLKHIRDTMGVTILLITHEMSVIKACCDRVGILHQGQLIEENNVGEFFFHPQTTVAQNFIASSLPQTLPPALEQYLLTTETPHTHPVFRLWFLTDTTTQPIISQLINRFNLRINILRANVEYIKKHALGIMIIAADGDKTNLQKSQQYLTDIGVKVEVIGHVPNDVIPFD